ncbi:MAG: hypothetical protein JXR41_02980 [Bacteroidales bacterium]|nr:hypothetical protein [Bacteroidales bacterium]MBN2762030.1 hypothetical protein [Bacteroidales bacterium]
MKKEKILEAVLVITTGMLVIYLVTHQPVFLYISVASGVVGILFKPLAKLMAALWYKTGELLGNVVSKIVLTLVFFLLLVPIAFLYRFFHKDPLHLKKTAGSNWSVREHNYCGDDLKNIW